MSEIERLLYHSHALIGEYSVEALDILRAAQARNGALGITGCLHHEDGLFVQCIEGRPSAVVDILRRLKADHRHCALTVFSREEVTERFFSSWTMSYTSNHLLSLAAHLERDLREAPPTPADASATLDFLRKVADLKSPRLTIAS